MTAPGHDSRDGGSAFAWWALLLFAVVLALLTRQHEPWHDELQAWRLAIDSSSIADLRQNLRYEGHPLLPYLLIRMLGFLSRSWTAVVVAHAVVACGSAWLVLRYAPFTRLSRLMIVFGYYFIYEYAVVVRPYGLGMAFALAACAAWCGTRRREGVTAILLILLANTSAVGLALAIAMAFGFTVDATDAWGARWWTTGARWHRVGAAWIVVALVTLASALQILPPADAVYRGGGAAVSDGTVWMTGRALSIPARALLPFAATATDGTTQWNTWAFDPASRAQVVLTDLLSCLVVMAGALVVSRRRSAVLLWLFGCAGFIVYFTLFHPGAVRHHGYVAVLFISAAWLAFAQAATTWRDPLRRLSDRVAPFRRPILAALLLPMLGAAVQLARADTTQQFASATEIIALLQRNRLLSLPIVGASYPWSQPVAALLDRPIAIPIEGRTGTWVDAGRVRRDRSATELTDSTVRALFDAHCQLVVLTDGDSRPSAWLSAVMQRLSPVGPTPMSGRSVAAWLATAPRCRAASPPAVPDAIK